MCLKLLGCVWDGVGWLGGGWMVAGAAAAASDILARIDAKGLISDSLQTVVSVANRVWTKNGGMTSLELVKVLIN